MSQGSTGSISVSIPFSVPFHDIDLTGVAWHGRYLKYFELARDALMDRLDYSYQEMRRSGHVFPVVEAQVRYIRPLRLQQPLMITAVLKEWDMRVVVSYRIHDEDGLTYTKGSTTQVAVKAETWEMQLGSPSELIEKVTERMTAESSAVDHQE